MENAKEIFEQHGKKIAFGVGALLFIVLAIFAFRTGTDETDTPSTTGFIVDQEENDLDESGEQGPEVTEQPPESTPEEDDTSTEPEPVEETVDTEALRERWGDEAAAGEWQPERPSGMSAEEWWENTIMRLWFEGDDATFVPETLTLIEAWSDPQQSDVEVDVAAELSEDALALATAEFTADYEEQIRWEAYFGTDSGIFHDAPSWLGWEPISSAAAVLGDDENWVQVLVLWEAAVDPYTQSDIRGVQSTLYYYQQTSEGTWVAQPCFEATHVPSPCRNSFQL